MLKFLVFSDLHYKKGMYAVKVQDLKDILKRGKENGVDFVLHAGDFSNDYVGSPEIVNTYLRNEYGFPVYGVYGNHELETENNSMEVVTPLLTNDPHVARESGDSGHYYIDRNGYRFIFADTNYSYNEAMQAWEHNHTASWGEPEGNLYSDSLGPEQLKWLEAVLTDAARKEISCVLVSHAGFVEGRECSPDAKTVRALIRKVNGIRPGTVKMCINGHYHTNHLDWIEDVLYFDVNTAINGFWLPRKAQHYTDAHTFQLEDYDARGNYLRTKTVPLTELWQSINTHYFQQPLSAVVTFCDDGTIRVEGSHTEWCYGIEPEDAFPGTMPCISSL